MARDIAIIGMAGRFPQAENIDQLFDNLCRGTDAIAPITPERIFATTLPPDKTYKACGYRDNIDMFDYRFFNLSMAEAQSMDPNQRQLLEVVHELFDNAGYSIDDFDGTNTAVFAGDVDLEYHRLASKITPLLATGNTRAFLATRVSRAFNLTGSAITIDTTCSSSLVALHYAVHELNAGDADCAVVCGSNLELLPFKTELFEIDLESRQGKSRSFSKDADGMAWGEMTVAILLKPLDKALADNDTIHAVIKATAVNNDARRSSSLTSPDSLTQAELLRTAWRKAGINPAHIRFIEGHGSATQLGDSIEAEGLCQAFSEFTDEKKICSLSSIKANVGHGRSAAGLAGLIKAVLSLKNNVFFPAPHAEAPSDLIDFENSPIYLHTKLTHWPSEPGVKRYAGVSSIGITGTNAHVVLEETPEARTARSTIGNVLLPVSAKTLSSLTDAIKALQQRLQRGDLSGMGDVSYTLGVGRKHHAFRTSVIADSPEAAVALLEKKMENIRTITRQDAGASTLFFLFFTPETDIADHHHYIYKTYPAYASAYTQCLKHFTVETDRVRTFAFQYALYKLLEAFGIQPDRVAGIGIGEVIASLITGDTALEDGDIDLEDVADETLSEDRIRSFITRECASGRTIFVEIGCAGTFSSVFGNSQALTGDSQLIKFNHPAEGDPLLNFTGKLYDSGYDADWKKFFAHTGGRRIALPGYSFEKNRCWIREEVLSGFYNPAQDIFGGAESTASDTALSNLTEVEQELVKCWKRELGQTQIGRNDNFFELGGDSLMATRVINAMRKQYGVALDFEDLFDYSTVAELGAYIGSLLDTSQRLTAFWKEVLKVEALSLDDNFFELGGHSLIATQVVNRIRQAFGVALNFESFFQYPTVRSQAAYIDALTERGEVVKEAITRVKEASHYETSHAQQRLWILGQLEGGSVAYNIPGAYEFKGEVDQAALKRAFGTLIDRHEILRTIFITVDGEPRQQVLPSSGFVLAYTDARSVGKDEASIHKLVDQEVNEFFELGKGPLLRARLIQTDSDRYVFVFTMHHIISDGWSMVLFAREVLSLYETYRQGKERTLRPLPIQYKDYSHWQNRMLREKQYEADRTYWIKQMQGAKFLQVTPDFERPAQKTFNGRIHKYSLGTALYEASHTFSKHHDVSTFMLMVAALNSLLYLETREEDIVVGSPVSGRIDQVLEGQFGMYANTVLLRSAMNREQTFLDVLKNARDIVLKANEHQNYPFDLLVNDLNHSRSASHSALFEIGFTYHDWRAPLDEFNSSLEIKEYDFEFQYVKTDLWFHVVMQTNEILLTIEYNSDLFSVERIILICEKFKALLEYVLISPDTKIATWNISTDVEKSRSARSRRFEFDFN